MKTKYAFLSLACSSAVILSQVGCETTAVKGVSDAFKKVTPILPYGAQFLSSADLKKYQTIIELSVISGELAKFLSEQDQQNVAASSAAAVETGQKQQWENRETGVRGSSQVVSTTKKTEDIQIQHTGQAVSIPPLELIGSTYKTTAPTYVYAQADAASKVVATVKAGGVAEVIGKVLEADWYYLGRDGAGVGFAQVSQFNKDPEPVAGESATAATSAAAGQTQTVSVEREYKVVSQEIMLPDGTLKQDQVTLVKNPDGKWVRADKVAA